jgi:hypothetical protein
MRPVLDFTDFGVYQDLIRVGHNEPEKTFGFRALLSF